jgi:recombination protein RecR
MDSLNKLIERFREFPGIGPRQARRFAYFLLTKNPSYLEELAHLVTDIKKTIRLCSSCYRFYSIGNKSLHAVHSASAKKDSTSNLCPICLDPSREKNLLMVVARDVDFEAIEKSGTYRGLYFILGGTVPYLEKNPETRIRLRELTAALAKPDKADLSEIILSLNANPEGEHTAEIVRASLKDLAEKKLTKITILGRGLSTGSELEYTDADTIMNALRNRG